MTPFLWGLFMLCIGVLIGALIVTAYVVSGTIARNEERLHWAEDDDWTPPPYAQQVMNRELMRQAGYEVEPPAN